MTSIGDPPNRTMFPQVHSGLDADYPNNIFIGCLVAGVRATCTQDSGVYKGTGKIFAGQSRFTEWNPKFEAEFATNSVPTLTYVILPDDHTNGTTMKDFTP